MKHYFLTFLMAMISIAGFAQEYSLGMEIDDDKYKEVPLKATLMTRDYTSLPASASLKKWCPIPKSQGRYGTCVGWSSAYAARTIVEAKSKGWTNKQKITSNTFSPGFLYKLIKYKSDYGCKRGSHISDAMQVMVNRGVPKYTVLPTSCVSSIPTNVYSKAKNFKIQDYARLFDRGYGKNLKIRSMKKSLAAGHPVVIGMKCPRSFFKAKGFWKPQENPNLRYGGHAMCVIGYDDNKFGGAFEIMNSWGTKWGNQGFIWVKYDDFANFTKYAYEVIYFPKKLPGQIDLSGELKFMLASGKQMEAEYVRSTNKVAYYKMKKPYSSGTQFRMFISNNEPAYVYAIGSDLTEEVFRIFPSSNRISPALNNPSNNVAIPGEDLYVKMDNKIGTDYMCFLYSKKKLNFRQIRRQLKNYRGSLVDRIEKVLANDLVNSKNARFDGDKMRFKASSSGKSVAAIVVEITHVR